MSDISITVTADPAQALQGLEAVRKKADELAESQRKVQEASDAAATDSMNSISTVSREMASTVAQTGDALSTISGGIRTAGTEAGKVAGALGKSIPVISQIGQAIATAITGPVGAVSAAVGLAVAGIMKMIQKAKDQVELLKLQAGNRTSTAFEALMQGRKDYAEQLAVLAQVREINRYAQENKLTTDQLAQFRSLASQIGIAERDVGDRGIRSGKLGAAARSLQQQREHYAALEYRDYTSSFDLQLLNSVMESGISIEWKNKLGAMSTADRVKAISQAARLGQGSSTGEYKAWQDLYGMVKQYNDVVSSYGRDALLGRSQTDLNSIVAENFRKAADKAAKDAASGSSGPATPGTLAYAREQDKLAQKELDAQKARAERGERLLENLDRQIQQDELIAEGKGKEAFMLRNRLQYEDTLGEKLTQQQIAEIDARSERLWMLQHPEEPALAPEDPAAAPVRTRARAEQQYIRPLDRLQAIGANLRNPAVSPEKMVMDKQLTVQEEIRNILRTGITGSYKPGDFLFP